MAKRYDIMEISFRLKPAYMKKTEQILYRVSL
jgi:hypothetical protein